MMMRVGRGGDGTDEEVVGGRHLKYARLLCEPGEEEEEEEGHAQEDAIERRPVSGQERHLEGTNARKIIGIGTDTKYI